MILAYPVAGYLFVFLLLVLKMPPKLVSRPRSSFAFVVEYGLESGKNSPHGFGIVAKRTFNFFPVVVSVNQVIEAEVFEFKVENFAGLKLVAKSSGAAYALFSKLENAFPVFVSGNLNIAKITIFFENLSRVLLRELIHQAIYIGVVTLHTAIAFILV